METGAGAVEGYQYSLDFKVRDSECDLQGIVNNSNYLVYLEHARHEYLLSRNLDFAELTRQGIFLVVTRVEIDYRQPLRSGDHFQVCLNLHRRGRIRFEFQQDIYRTTDRAVMVNAKVYGAATNREGRPIALKGLDHLFADAALESGGV